MKHCPLCNWPWRMLEPNHIVRCIYSGSVAATAEIRLMRKKERSIVPLEKS